MALETLHDVKELDGFSVRRVNEEMGLPIPMYLTNEGPIVIDDLENIIAFKIQKGPIKEVGVNGCQVDTLIATALQMIKRLNNRFPCHENFMAITKIQESLMWLRERKRERESRGVEGTSEA